MSQGLRVALVHDWLTGMRGGERCLEALCELFPAAPIYTLLHVPGSVSPFIEGRVIRTSFVQSLPFSSRLYRSYLPLLPAAIERLDMHGYDLVLSSSHCVAKGIIPQPGSKHICYCYTPMRYVWTMYDEYFGPARTHRVVRASMPLVANYLRTWDTESCARVDRFVAISHTVRRRIWRFYRRGSEVVYPPVNTQSTWLSEKDDGYYLLVSAFAPYKRLDLAIRAFACLGERLVVVGSGQEEKRLKALAGRNIHFVGYVSDQELWQYYAGCRALVFPGEEDFGMVPVEAQCFGKPVIAYGAGGALETVRGVWADGASGTDANCDAATGVFFRRQTVEDLVDALRLLGRSHMDPTPIRQNGLRFGRDAFDAGIRSAVERTMAGPDDAEAQS